MKRERVWATGTVAVLAVAAFFFLPLPYSIKCTFEIQPHAGRQIYPTVAGLIQEVHYKPGQQVKSGDVLMQLENADLRLELLDLKGRYEGAEQAVQNLNKQRFFDVSVIDQIQMAEEVRASALKQYEEKKKEIERLTIAVPEGAGGTIIPPPSRIDKLSGAHGKLPSWEGTPFDAKNQGALLQPTDLICQIGDPENVEAVLIIDQRYIDLVRIDPVKGGPPVRLLLEAHTRKAFDSQIAEIASTEMKVASPGMSAAKGGRLETKMEQSGLMRPLNTSYQARAPLGNAAGALEAGMQGQARIYTGWQPLFQRVYRLCVKTFNFDL